MLQQLSQDRVWGQIVAKSWSDDEFKERVLSDPEPVFAEYGLELPAGTEVVVHDSADFLLDDDSPSVRHFILPDSPAGEFDEEELVGAGAESTVPWCYCGACGRCGRCGCGCGGCS
jgi:hypothetical protein